MEFMGASEVTIDSIDAKLITLLLKNARTKTKDLAKACGISSTAVGKRIKKLKENGTITGSAIMLNMSQMGYMYPTSISIERMREEHSTKIISLVKNRSGLTDCNISFGKSDFYVFVVAKSLKDLDYLKQSIRRYVTGKVSVNLWNTPYLCFDNINIDEKKRSEDIG
jgi:Lrp/AsnC family transcriptional regulator, regulator for asnA, asnC and gidA